MSVERNIDLTVEDIDEYEEYEEVQWDLNYKLNPSGGDGTDAAFFGAELNMDPVVSRGEIAELVAFRPLRLGFRFDEDISDAGNFWVDQEWTWEPETISEASGTFKTVDDPNGVFNPDQSKADTVQDLVSIWRASLVANPAVHDTTNTVGLGGHQNILGSMEPINFRHHFGRGPLFEKDNFIEHLNVLRVPESGAAFGEVDLVIGAQGYFDVYELEDRRVRDIKSHQM